MSAVAQAAQTVTDRRGEPLLTVEDLHVRFPVRGPGRRQWLRAVQDVSFTIGRGETLGLVGESGSGKSTIGNALLRLVPVHGGSIRLGDTDVLTARGKTITDVRRRMAMVFQDPLAALDPRSTVADSVAEPLKIHRIKPTGGRRARVTELMDLVGLPQRFLDRYPHELSGGQRQRVCIARALAADPELLILDEATASLDVSVQSQIMNLLRQLQDEMGLSYLFISHDLASVEHMSDRVLVLYLGRIMERSPRESLYVSPGHPYTQALISAIPLEDPVVERERRRIILEGDIPSPIDPPSGCVFRTRCPLAIPECAEGLPPGHELGPDHTSYCIRAGEQVAGSSPAADAR
ncbi:ABC transporter ATP-binding protein [Ornithinimicrobium cryptoxanthini]|uniref:ABC transporter ATP-binding protein n=1 Tax=Ornithinimicrobium cryptoxanthini TaxID=2934161 RepID=A0ABY4YL95_9MICO|nr:ABC transporter ATP-binding protein [Ornithinimicrobium cryptoxanthini]USQ77374.1 ABC transporter ATP-binding protein [Ornithinimicrobium cryptoxanthini]